MKIRFRKFIGLLMVLGMLLTGCSDACDDVTCNNGGTCDEGICACAIGYEGTNCDDEVRAKFLGAWNSTNWICDGHLQSTTTLTITPGPGILDILVEADGDGIVNATIDGNTITFPEQTIETTTLSGSGTLDGSTLSLSLNAMQDTDEWSCAGSYTK